MGDTFQDNWEDQVPKEWKDWVLLQKQNTKWNGNNYEFEHKREPKHSCWRITLHSSSPTEMDLSGQIYINDRASASDDYNRYEIDLTIKVHGGWTSIEEAMQKLDDVFHQAYSRVTGLRSLARSEEPKETN